MSAVISYYGFFSLFPALLAFVTIVYLVLGSQPTLLAGVLAALWTVLPFVGSETKEQLNPISGSGAVVAVALLIALWGAVGVVRVLQDALNVMWCVPTYRRPGIVAKLGRGLAVLGLIGVAIFVTGAVTVVTLQASLPGGGVVVLAVVNIGIDFVLAGALFEVLTARRLSGRQLWPGALLGGTSAYLLTLLGGVYVDHVVAQASAIYGSFATVIGLLGWTSLLVQTFVLANLVNVVRVERLWPRTIAGGRLGDGDVRAIELSTRREAIVSAARLATAHSARRADDRDGDITPAG